MTSAPNPPQGGNQNLSRRATVGILIILGILVVFFCILNLGVTISIIGIVIALLQNDGVRSRVTTFLDTLLKQAKASLPIVRSVRRLIWKYHSIILLLIILVLWIEGFTPVPNIVHNLISTRPSTVPCDNVPASPTSTKALTSTPAKVTSMLVNGNYMNIGIISYQDQNASPFNQFDNHNDDAEHKVEKLIFDENTRYSSQPYVTLIVATTLSQTVSDLGMSSSAGLDLLRGAYMAQHKRNLEDNNQPKLRLLIANFGTKDKDTISVTVPVLMKQIQEYADSDTQHFIGVVGFPFSNLVQSVLTERDKIGRTDIPIITSAAEANSFTDDSTDNTSSHFYDNFYSIAPSDSDHSQVILDFIKKHRLSSLQETRPVVFVDSHKNRYSSDLSESMIRGWGSQQKPVDKKDYTAGQPDTLDPGINDIINGKYNLIFFAGYADDFNILRNKLKANPATQNIPIIGGEGLYYPYPTIYNNSGNSYNYTNLFFTTDAAYTKLDDSDSGATFNNKFCQLFYHANPPGMYGYALPGFHTILMYDAVSFFLRAWDQRGNPDDSTSPRWQVIDKQLSKTNIDGISGFISYTDRTQKSFSLSDLDLHPISKPVYVACIDSAGYTHVVAKYHVDHQTPSDTGPHDDNSFNQGEADQCTK
jgi:ABC-type branched-subunit amino acid transport system substrate-binding protein